METVTSWDFSIFRFINNLAGSMSWLNPVVIFLAEYAIFVLAALMIILWIIKPQMRKALMAAFIAFIVSAILAKLAGMLFSHPQPFANPDLPNVFRLISKEPGNSFPSDHTAAAFAVCVAMFLGSKSKWKFFYMLLALLMGVSRIWVGVHYPIDVLAGMLIGTLVALITYPLVMRSQFINAFLAFYENIERKVLVGKGKHKKH